MAQTKSGSVLLVEDNQDIAEMVYAFLERRGYELDYAADGVTGLHLAVTNSYDVIVLTSCSRAWMASTFAESCATKRNAILPY